MARDRRSRVVEFFRIDAPGNHRLIGRGALSPAVAILAVMIFTLAGLVIDGGRQLGARSRAVGYAQEAARVGAATIQLNNAEAKIDTAKAATAISAFCAQVSSNDPAVTSCAPDQAHRGTGRHPGRHRQQDDVPRPDRQDQPESLRHRHRPRRTGHQEGRRQPDHPADRGADVPRRSGCADQHRACRRRSICRARSGRSVRRRRPGRCRRSRSRRAARRASRRLRPARRPSSTPPTTTTAPPGGGAPAGVEPPQTPSRRAARATKECHPCEASPSPQPCWPVLSC